MQAEGSSFPSPTFAYTIMSDPMSDPAGRRIPIAGPWITEHEVEMVAEATRTAWYDGAGQWAERFEHAFANYVGRRHAIALPSCTSGLHLSLAALGIGPGDEVIVPESTWIASAAPISYVGATPVFVDVDPGHWCIDVDAVRSAITEHTRAVIVVDLYGGVPDFDALEALCDKHGIALIEDAAQAVGAEFLGRRAGSFGRTSVFSFHGTKTLTTGEGGMVLTDSDDLHRRMLFLRDQGRHPGDRTFFNEEVAFKYKMSELQAALGLAQLQRVEDLVHRKRQIFGWYFERLGDLKGLQCNAERPDTKNAYWMMTAIIDPAIEITGQMMAEVLNAANIVTRPFFHPLSSLPAYAHLKRAGGSANDRPVSASLGKFGINLPSALILTEEDVDVVCKTVRHVPGIEGH